MGKYVARRRHSTWKIEEEFFYLFYFDRSLNGLDFLQSIALAILISKKLHKHQRLFEHPRRSLYFLMERASRTDQKKKFIIMYCSDYNRFSSIRSVIDFSLSIAKTYINLDQYRIDQRVLIFIKTIFNLLNPSD